MDEQDESTARLARQARLGAALALAGGAGLLAAATAELVAAAGMGRADGGWQHLQGPAAWTAATLALASGVATLGGALRRARSPRR
jgi:hypothetical protein